MIVFDWLIDLLTLACLLGGAFFLIVSGIGVLRLPDFYTRLHAAGITDTMGAGLILLGLMLQAGFTQVTIKLVLIVVFLFFASPTSTHAVAQAALSDPENPPPQLKPQKETPPLKS